MQEDLRSSGYDKEEQYFHKLNQELIKKRRKRELSTGTGVAAEERRLTCPNCGEQMKGMVLAAISLDRCSGCGGVFFDHGELEALLDSYKPKGFFECVGNWF